MAKMMKDGVDFEELEELAAKVGFKLECDADYITLFQKARECGFWPELDIPKTDTKGIHIPPAAHERVYRLRPEEKLAINGVGSNKKELERSLKTKLTAEVSILNDKIEEKIQELMAKTGLSRAEVLKIIED